MLDTIIKLPRTEKFSIGTEYKRSMYEMVENILIISKVNDGIVVLATGNLDKKLNVKATRFTAKAKEEIEALGGKAEVI